MQELVGHLGHRGDDDRDQLTPAPDPVSSTWRSLDDLGGTGAETGSSPAPVAPRRRRPVRGRPPTWLPRPTPRPGRTVPAATSGKASSLERSPRTLSSAWRCSAAERSRAGPQGIAPSGPGWRPFRPREEGRAPSRKKPRLAGGQAALSVAFSATRASSAGGSAKRRRTSTSPPQLSVSPFMRPAPAPDRRQRSDELRGARGPSSQAQTVKDSASRSWAATSASTASARAVRWAAHCLVELGRPAGPLRVDGGDGSASASLTAMANPSARRRAATSSSSKRFRAVGAGSFSPARRAAAYQPRSSSRTSGRRASKADTARAGRGLHRTSPAAGATGLPRRQGRLAAGLPRRCPLSARDGRGAGLRR